MKEFILFMHSDARRPGKPEEWDAYFTRLRASGRFQGGSEIGSGESVRKDEPAGPIHDRIGGFIRVLANDLEDAKEFVLGNPVYEAGGTVEVRELPRTD